MLSLAVVRISPAGVDGVMVRLGSVEVTAWPSIVAVIMNYARRSATRGTFLESHFRWQIRTFWWAVFWALFIAAVTFPLWLVLIGIPMTFIGVAVLGIWIIGSHPVDEMNWEF